MFEKCTVGGHKSRSVPSTKVFMRHTKPLPIKAKTAYREAEKAGRHVQVMSPMTDTTAMIRRRRGEEGEEAEAMDHEDLQLPALEDGRVVEDRIVGQELVPTATPAVLNDAEALTGERGLVQAERPRPEDIQCRHRLFKHLVCPQQFSGGWSKGEVRLRW